ncbi:hypothetical protein ACR03S_16645 (plasmid) [Limimaricola variabilis]
MQQLYLTMALAAFTVVGLGLTSGLLQKLPLSRPLLALAIWWLRARRGSDGCDPRTGAIRTLSSRKPPG